MRLLLPLLFLNGCEQCDCGWWGTRAPGVATGTIRGRVCSPNGHSWLADATVYTNVIDADDRLIETKIAYTDLNGVFELDRLLGDSSYTIYAQDKDEIVTTYDDVFVGAGETDILPDPTCGYPGSWRPQRPD